jgi:hypothetical protein
MQHPTFVGLFLWELQYMKHLKLLQQVLIYDQQFNSPETLNIATVTKLIRNTFLL